MEHGAESQKILAVVIRPIPNVGGAGSTDILHLDSAQTLRLISNKKHSGSPSTGDSSRYEDTRILIRSARDDGITNVIIDLSRTRWIDSTDLGFWISMQHEIATAGGVLVIAGSIPRITHIFAETKLDHVFRVFGSLEEAVESFLPKGKGSSA